ncbi:MAG: hypothetical protein KTR17_07905 [Cellvibrionaceae bacterium]|nr:hypothetical protein [Cellvibrionaceae bacterium]
MTKPLKPVAFGLVLGAGSSLCVAQTPDFITFESGHVRPLAISQDGTTLFACNTPDNRLEMFSITENGLQPLYSIPVGLEPVSVAINGNNEVWVVNHLSDSVSIVDLSVSPPRVTKTLLVGDEPRDIVFSANGRAFITTAHRGQQRTDRSIDNVPGAGDPQLTTPSVPRADVWVFDAADQGRSFGGTPLKIIELFSDTPRALTLSPDGLTVYAAALFSGNQTASVSEGTVCPHEEETCEIKGQLVPGGIVGPKTDASGERAPLTGIIVKFNRDTGRFEDPEGRDWTDVVKFSLPDKDVFEINAATLEETRSFNHVGTTIFNMVTNPVTGTIYASNFEANNIGLFEGPGDFAGETLQGHLSEARITVINEEGVFPRHLNKHIDYDITPAPEGVKEHSLAMPLDMVVSSDGDWLAVAAYGSKKIGVFATEALENDDFDPEVDSANYIELSGGGPSGLILDESRNQLYVITRFDNTVTIVNLETKREIDRRAMFNPEPQSVVEGRIFLYDADISSSNGEAACASCHIFGDLDHLAWNLGNPDDEILQNPADILLDIAAGLGGGEDGGGIIGFLGSFIDLGGALDTFTIENVNGTGDVNELHPNKGPMTTQSLKGLINHGPMHWRGDRSNGFFGIDESQEPPFDSELSFNNFIVAFEGLHGREEIIDPADMQKFTDFALQMVLPPNPVRALDNSLNRAETRGREFYFGCAGSGFIICNREGRPVFGEHRSDGVPLIPNLGFTCEGCHTLDPANGFFGTDGTTSFDVLNQVTKIAQIRNVYTKVGMFGAPPSDGVNAFDNENKGDQIRGFGMFHDGGIETILRFMNGEVFNSAFNGQVGFEGGNPQRQDIEAFMLAFDSDLPPITGQQITLSAQSNGEVEDRVDLLIERAEQQFASQILGGEVRECELVASAVIDGTQRAWLYNADDNRFISDRSGENAMQVSALKNLARTPGQETTFTCVPFGSGTRIALDRDRDGTLNGDE